MFLWRPEDEEELTWEKRMAKLENAFTLSINEFKFLDGNMDQLRLSANNRAFEYRSA